MKQFQTGVVIDVKMNIGIRYLKMPNADHSKKILLVKVFSLYVEKQVKNISY